MEKGIKMRREKVTSERLAWSLAEIAETMGLSVGYLRNEVRAKRLPVKRFGRRVLVLDSTLRRLLDTGSTRESGDNDTTTTAPR
jgi:excisionase family DNA binding protein